MSRRKGEVTGHMNEREFPHLVELELPPGGFRSQNLEFDAFHRERGIPIRRGRGRHEVEQFHVRFCFPMPPLLMAVLIGVLLTLFYRRSAALWPVVLGHCLTDIVDFGL